MSFCSVLHVYPINVAYACLLSQAKLLTTTNIELKLISCIGIAVSGRVRVAVRLRPRNDEEMVADADFADCVELQPEFKRLKLRKNNWDSDTYEFDEVLTESASQKRVYEVVAKPVVESVLDGYNGTVMAYGQTGTGKTFTLGRLGDEDTSARGIMVRAMEDILANIRRDSDSVMISYLQLYMETVQDLLNPTNDNISIVEDPKTGDVSVPAATLVDIRSHHDFMELLRLGEAHRLAANTKLNTESSRSHAILMVHIKRSVMDMESEMTSDNDHSLQMSRNSKPPIIRKGKLVVVDLAGSERVHKSGSEGHTLEEAKSINLSLSALGKCINALAENSPHVPVRDSKLTRLLKDSFGGTARTSLIVTVGPSPRHRAETASTILFGQRMHGDETPDAYLNRAQEYADALAAIGEPVKDKDLVMLVVSGLCEEYNGLKTTITARQSPTAFSELHALLSDHDYMLEKTRTPIAQYSPRAFYGARPSNNNKSNNNNHRGNRNNSRGNNNRGRDNGRQFNWASTQNTVYGTCNRCGIDHIPSQCHTLLLFALGHPLTLQMPVLNPLNASANWHSDTEANSHLTPDYPSTIRTRPSANFANARAQSS
nr:kinesin-like protein KIN-UA [Tanacetum cinerariifolium]